MKKLSLCVTLTLTITTISLGSAQQGLNLKERAAKSNAQQYFDGKKDKNNFNLLPDLFKRQIAKEYYYLAYDKKNNPPQLNTLPTFIQNNFHGVSIQDDINHGKTPKITQIYSGLDLSLYIEVNRNIVDLAGIERIPKIDKIKRFTIANNPLSKISPYALSSLKNLEDLTIYNNKIKKLDTNTFAGINKLKKLHFGMNNTETIKPGSFLGLKGSLKELALDKKFIENKKIAAQLKKELPNTKLIKIYPQRPL